MLLKYSYTVFIGILLATFVGVGIAAFYKVPKPPEYPVELSRPFPEKDDTASAQYVEQQRKQDNAMKAFQKKSEEYNKNVSIISLISAVIFVTAGLFLVSAIYILSDGLLLGGLFTLLYSIARGFSANDDIYRFLVVTAGLLIALTVGYIRFVKPATKPSS